jgi:hypothetical protein
MDMKRLYILGIVFLQLAFFACKKNETHTWIGEDYGRIEGPKEWTLSTDSIRFSFAQYQSTVENYEFLAKVYITGKVADVDRKVGISVDGKTTTAATNQYDIPAVVVIPKNEHFAILPIKIKRTADLIQKAVRLKIVLNDQEEIKPGTTDWNNLNIIWSDILMKPINWENLTEFFKDYSDTKYRFIIDVLKIGDFTYGKSNGMTWGEMNNYRLQVIQALQEYNAAHPGNPLTDENNQLVTF